MGERVPSRSLSMSPPPPPPPPSLPYEVLFTESFDDILEPLPSAEDIEESTEVIRAFSARCTAYVGESFVAKYGSEVKPIEGRNMRFARKHLDPDVVTIPRVLAIYQRPISPPCHITYIVMERIAGDTFENKWDEMVDAQKQVVSSQLRRAFRCLRNIPHPGFYGSIDKSGPRDDLFLTDTPIPMINGPFDSVDELVEAMIARYARDVGSAVQRKADFYRRVLPQALKGDNAPVFTHGDFQRKNVIILPDGSIALVDWAESGRYPSYWEYATAIFACGSWFDNWHAFLGRILDEYPTEFAWMHMRIEMWG